VSRDEHVESSHHRIEKRQVFSVRCPALLHQQAGWIGLKSVVMVVRTRQLWNKTTHQVQFYLTSLESDAPTVALCLHWGIENQLHWTLDVAEDASAYWSCTAKSLLRRIALNSLNRELSFKRSTRQKSNRAAMDNDYMLKVLAFNPTSMRNPLVNRV